MEIVNNPHTNAYDPNHGNYNPNFGQPQGGPSVSPGGGYPPNQPAPNQPAPNGQPGFQGPPSNPGGYPGNTPGGYPANPPGAYPGGYPANQQPAGQPAGQPNQAPPVPGTPPRSASPERKQFIELGTQSGQPLEVLNLVMMTGYFHHMRDNNGNPKFTETGNSVRLGFSLAEKITWTDQNGQSQQKVVWHRCQAWNDYARTLVQVVDGTPIKIWGNLTVFYIRDDAGNINGTLVDIRVNKFDFP